MSSSITISYLLSKKQKKNMKRDLYFKKGSKYTGGGVKRRKSWLNLRPRASLQRSVISNEMHESMLMFWVHFNLDHLIKMFYFSLTNLRYSMI